jgi:glycosyltransferase involved in cell wall biosynthesis
MTYDALISSAPKPDTVTAPKRLRAYLLSYSAIADDPRVRRVGDLLHANGWEVVGIGLSGARSAPPAWPIRIVEIEEPTPAKTSPNTAPTPDTSSLRVHGRASRSLLGGLLRNSPLRPVINCGYAMVRASLRRMKALLRKAITLLRDPQIASRVWARGCQWFALTMRQPDAIERWKFWPTHPLIQKMLELAHAEERPGVWIANDWLMLPVAAAGASASAGVYVYDSHEFAIEEYAQNAEWRRNRRPIAAAIERKFIKDAKFVTSVSPDITAALCQLYQLRVATDTIRNAPAFQRQFFRATGERIRILYHGVVAPGRGLEESIDSVASWRDEFDLTIRGPESPAGYINQLRTRIRERGVGRRVEIVPPVPMTQLVSAAAPFDIGLMALPGHSAHNRFALPNKIFEYMMAGLALCVSDLTSMRAVVAETGAGLTIAEVTPQAIARAVNSFDRNKVDAYRRAALSAAERYSWNEEGARLLTALELVARGI